MKRVLIISLIIMVLCGCNKNISEQGDTMNDIIAKNNYIIVDVRTSEEYSNSHIKSAINIPYDVITSTNLDKTKTILVYCQSGGRSKIAYNVLKSAGYDVFDLGAFDSIDLEKE